MSDLRRPLPGFLAAPAAASSAAQPRLLTQRASYAAQAPVAPVAPPPTDLKPVFSAQGELLGFVATPRFAPGAMMPPAPPTQPAPPTMGRDQRMGRAVLTTANAGLGVASIAFPPVLPIAAIATGVAVLDHQLGDPVAKSVGFLVNGAGTVGKYAVDGVVSVARGIGDVGQSVGQGIGDFFGGIFKKRTR